MIRVCYISKHRPKPEVTFSEIKVIWGHEVKLPISVIWRRSTCLWVGLSSRMQTMTLEHRLLHINRNKMNIWNCIVLRPNALESSHFHIQNAIKTTIGVGTGGRGSMVPSLFKVGGNHMFLTPPLFAWGPFTECSASAINVSLRLLAANSRWRERAPLTHQSMVPAPATADKAPPWDRQGPSSDRQTTFSDRQRPFSDRQRPPDRHMPSSDRQRASLRQTGPP